MDMSVENGQFKIFVNGQPQSSVLNDTNGLLESIRRVIVGADYYVGWQQFFTGTIDEVAIYNRALTADEILAHYNRTNSGVDHYCNP